MFVVMSKFVVLNNMQTEVQNAFINRPQLVDKEPGFIRMEVLNPIDQPDEFILLTYWQDESSWQQWFKSHAYKESHRLMPKGLKLLPNSTEISYYQLISE